MRGAELVVRALKDASVRYVFGYTGGTIMPVFDEMLTSGGLVHIMPRHEQGAAFAAQGLSRATCGLAEPQIGVCMATSGPGALNLVTGIGDAMMDSIPLLAITGQVPVSVIGQDAFQESDIVGVLMPITKQASMPLSAREIEPMLHDALYLARTGRPGPVVLDIPKDVLDAETGDDYAFDLQSHVPHLPGFTYRPEPDPALIDEALRMIARSERPVILCGHGVIQSGSGGLLRTFARRHHIPVASTLHGISALPSGDPLHLGMMGMHGSYEANRAIHESDLLIAFGMRFDMRVTGRISTFAPQASVIHVEIDASEIDKTIPATLAVHADVKRTLRGLLDQGTVEGPSRSDWWHSLERYRRTMADQLEQEIARGTGPQGRLLMKTIISRLSSVTEGQDLIVSDVGQHEMMCARFYDFQTPNSWFASGGTGTMGSALPMAIGVKLGRPDEQVWCVVGDGGMQMNLQELGTVMEYGIALKILILNNSSLGMVKQLQTLFYGGRLAATAMVNPDFGSIAAAYRLPYERVERVDQIDAALTKAQECPGACIVEFVCDSDELILPMIPADGGFDDIITDVIASRQDTQSKA